MQKRFMSCLPDAATWTAWRQQLTQATTTPWLWQAVTDRSAELFPRFAKVYHKLRSLPRRLRRQMQRRWACSLAGIALALVLTPNASWAANFTASNAAELAAAINSANANPDADTITITADITLTQRLPVVTSTITIAGNGHTIARQSSDLFRILEVQTGVVQVQETTLSGGHDPFDGGAIYNGTGTVTLTNSTVSGNTAGHFGGGIFTAGGSVTLTNSAVSGNSAYSGGGIATASGSVILTNSTVSGNHAQNAGGGTYTYSGSVILTNSTVSGNSADYNGGGIGMFGGSVTLTNSTVSGNHTQNNGGGIGVLSFGSGSMTLTNSLISGNNTSSYFPVGMEIFDISGSVSTNLAPNVLGHNGLSNGQAFFGFRPSATDITATSNGTTPTALSAILNPTLANNGGPTLTHALVTGSPAIDAADNAFCPETDQRGALRPFGTGCDIGSVESYPFVFTGFFHPVDNLPVVNEIKAGKALQVKFSLGGNYGLDVLADNSPSSQALACHPGDPVDPIEEETSSASGLTYDAVTNQYRYTWKTQKAWAGTCRQLKVSLADGSVHTALFMFK